MNKIKVIPELLINKIAAGINDIWSNNPNLAESLLSVPNRGSYPVVVPTMAKIKIWKNNAFYTQ